MLKTKIASRSLLPAAILLAALLLTACGVVNRSAYRAPAGTADEPSASFGSVQKLLYEAHETWRGTPYILGGSGTNGVDCSSFTQIVFDEKFDVSLPRNTREQLNTGEGIRRHSIRPGDLIFFKTTRRDLHVGIVVNREEFLHASVSSGVMISSLSDYYWAGRYLGARRVL
ncbi:MAG: NlpC/P60 family protein [Balneolaceae bacterium]